MIIFKPYPEMKVEESEVSGWFNVSVGRRDITIQCSEEDLQRIADCWNACRHLYSPAAHIPAVEDRANRAEELRKQAWAEVQVLRGRGSASLPYARL